MYMLNWKLLLHDNSLLILNKSDRRGTNDNGTTYRIAIYDKKLCSLNSNLKLYSIERSITVNF